jgi:hypothetical protein
VSFTDSHHHQSDLIQEDPNIVTVYQPWSIAVVSKKTHVSLTDLNPTDAYPNSWELQVTWDILRGLQLISFRMENIVLEMRLYLCKIQYSVL